MTKSGALPEAGESRNITLKRRLSLPLLTMYGLGVTIGAGIYVLVGATASRAGLYAPVSFVLAAAVVAFTAFSYSELGTRYPVSAGEAAYVKNGFNSTILATIVGLLVVLSGVVSAAAVTIGASAYLGNFVPLSPAVLTVVLVVLVGLGAAWGILESVTVAAVITMIEIGGLGLVIGYGVLINPDLFSQMGRLVPPLEIDVWSGIVSAGLLAFFAFVGFEDIANVAEEVIEPTKTLPRAIILTLVIATLVYFLVVSVVVLTVPMSSLVTSAAPLSLMFENAGSGTRAAFTVIAAFATINGMLIQVIMASRVLYGLADQGSLPRLVGFIHPVTRTPVVATLLVVVIILILALFLPIVELAERTSQIVLVVFILVNLALLRLKLLQVFSPGDSFQVPIWVPAIGALTSLLLLLTGFV